MQPSGRILQALQQFSARCALPPHLRPADEVAGGAKGALVGEAAVEAGGAAGDGQREALLGRPQLAALAVGGMDGEPAWGRGG